MNLYKSRNQAYSGAFIHLIRDVWQVSLLQPPVAQQLRWDLLKRFRPVQDLSAPSSETHPDPQGLET